MNGEFETLVDRLQGPILVVGASGFIGANMMLTLLDRRPDVMGTILSGTLWRLDGVPAERLVRLDLADMTSVREVIAEVEPRTVFDCSAYGGYSFETDAQRIHTTNYLGLLHLLSELGPRQIAAYIHAGTSSEYGLNSNRPSEDSVLRPNSHYAVSKAAAASLISYYGAVERMPAVNLRLYSAYGPWEDSSRLIPQVCLRSLEGSLPTLAGPDVTRDFVHVDDVVHAFVAAAVRVDPDWFGASVNVGTGTATRLDELARMCQSVLGDVGDPTFDKSAGRAWDTDRWEANPQRAADLFGWEPQIPLADGLVSTRDWWASHRPSDEVRLTSKAVPRARERGTISAVIACYKDAQAIPIMHARLTAALSEAADDYEIIFVNDGSPDDTDEVLVALTAADPRVRAITHARNFGSQAAFLSGMELSTMDACVLLDGDLQDPPELIPEFAQLWREGNDVVYGRRVKREMSALWEAMYKGFYAVFAWSSDIPIPRNAGDFSLMDRTVVDWLVSCPERDVLIRGLRAYVGFTQTGVDYVRPERMFGKSTNNMVRNMGWAKKAIFSYSRLPLHALTAVGFSALILSGVVALLAIGIKVFAPERTPQGITFLALLIAVFGSATVFGIGLLGEYIGKILEETKARPRFVPRHLIHAGRVTPASSPARTSPLGDGMVL